MVGNGLQLDSNKMYSNIPIILNKTTFHVVFYVLPISVADIVLGVQWLTTLGPISTNYAELTMSFMHKGLEDKLQGISSNLLEENTSHQLRGLQTT